MIGGSRNPLALSRSDSASEGTSSGGRYPPILTQRFHENVNTLDGLVNDAGTHPHPHPNPSQSQSQAAPAPSTLAPGAPYPAPSTYVPAAALDDPPPYLSANFASAGGVLRQRASTASLAPSSYGGDSSRPGTRGGGPPPPPPLTAAMYSNPGSRDPSRPFAVPPPPPMSPPTAGQMNPASAYRLPVVSLCGNNHHALSTPSHTVTGGRIFERAAGFGMPGVRAEDRQDVLSAYGAVDRVRAGEARAWSRW